VDGRFVGWLPIQPQALPAGVHRISLRKLGHQLSQQEVTLRNGETRRLNLDLTTTTQRDISKVLMLSGVVAMGAAGGLAAVAFVRDAEAKELHDTWRQHGGFTAQREAEYRSTRDSRDNFRTASILVGSTGALLGATGLVLYLADYPSPASTTEPERAPTPKNPTLDLMATARLSATDLGLDVIGKF
jgi:hypothetical protein